MKALNYSCVLITLFIAQLVQSQDNYSVLYFRANLKKVQSYEFFVANKSIYKTTRSGYISFRVYGTPMIDLKIIETLPDGKQRASEKEISVKPYRYGDGPWHYDFYGRIKKGKEIGKWQFGVYAMLGAKKLTQINVYNENGRTFFDRYDRQQINSEDKITKYDYKIDVGNYMLMNSLNSKDDDYFPTVNPSSTKLYFTSSRESRFGSSGEDLYTVNLYEGGIGEAKLLPEPLNSMDNEGVSTFTGDGQTMVYGRCNSPDGMGNCDLYTSSFNGQTWETPKNMGEIINSPSWDSHPSISADGSKLVFSSRREGGYGYGDLYVSYKNESGEWSIPENLGGIVNTPEEEKYSFLAPDGRTLYFSSSGHGGYGKTDMFKTVFIDGSWSEPVNMGEGINTSYDDLYFTTSASGDYAFFASEKPGGVGGLDIYQLGLSEEMKPTATTIVAGTVWDQSQNPIVSNIVIQDLSTGDYIANTRSNPKTGQYIVILPAGRSYSMTASSEGRFFNSQNFRLDNQSEYKEVNRNITLEEIKIGAKARLNNIFFDTGKSNLTIESRLDLNRVVKMMKESPTMVVEIGGHTDSVGDENLNISLSLKRAQSVKEYLIEAGISSDRLSVKGYGENKPFTTNLTEEGKALNRRIEFLIIDY
ncbi:OmpA family protein [Aquimarina sp. 2201CG5-10]|uniref:OmpA family protein n=1 Tax=Aquimarina callyspongiae TaxID=3098150 RepID=UPI002AB5CF7C|nr:OmpA family protein [Aquimarina sp. 2201CG5-10]MDY8134852.1 OmpA family protein [Aquimarina sp. 2201CG5-10]